MIFIKLRKKISILIRWGHTLCFLVSIGCLVVFIYSCKTTNSSTANSSSTCLPTNSPFGNGEGTKEVPYQICHPTHLNNVRQHSYAYFRLQSNIDLSETQQSSWKPIPRFAGYFNGNGFIIKNLYINKANKNNSLFATISKKGRIYNLGVYFNAKLNKVNILSNISSIASMNRGKIVQSHSQIWVEIKKASSKTHIGGLVSINHGTILQSFATGSITSQSETIIGGLVAKNEDGIIKNSYSTVNIKATTSPIIIGGMVGSNTGKIHNTYALGHIQVASYKGEVHVGSLVGINFISASISNSYFNPKYTKKSKGISNNFGVNNNITPLYKNYVSLKRLGWSSKVWYDHKQGFLPSLIFYYSPNKKCIYKPTVLESYPVKIIMKGDC